MAWLAMHLAEAPGVTVAHLSTQILGTRSEPEDRVESAERDSHEEAQDPPAGYGH